jgi:hypothetical protein
LENIEYNQKQQEIISGRNPEADYIPAYLSNFASMPNTQGATSDSIRSQNKRQQDKLDQRRNQTDEESILNLERFSRMMDMNSPNYSLVGSGFGFDLGETIDPVQRRIDSQSRLADRDPQAKEILAQREKRRQENYESSPFGGQLFVDNRPRDIRLGSNFTPATDFSGFDPVVDEFLSPYLNPNFDVSSDAAGGNAQKADTKRFGEGTRTANPETTAEAIETGMNTGSSEKTVQKDLSKDSDYSSLQAVIDEFKPVDYSAFKPDYLNLITEQERRAQKIRDDASKDASAQALIQLGAGLAAGDISKGLSAAGQSVADIKRQARAEARDEEGFARQLRLAQDEAGMQLGIKGAEAEREMARFKATYGVSLKELENTMTLAREQIAAEANTEAGRALRGELDALNNLIKNLMSEQYEGDIEQNKAAIAQAVSRMQFLLGITGEKQNEKKDTDVIETAKSVLGNQ